MVEIVTTRNRPNGPKPFAWSYSRLKNFETCGKRHYHVDILKDVKEEQSEQLQYGELVHKQLADYIGKGKEILPHLRDLLEPWAQRILTGGGNILVEQKLAITKDFGPCEFFDRQAWFRGVGDVVKVNGPVALVVDWKTGKIIEDSVQLALMAACVFAHHPAVQKVRSEFVWLKEDAKTSAVLDRSEMPGIWSSLWPRIEALRLAHETTSYPARPGRLCRKWCPVTACPYHGESHG